MNIQVQVEDDEIVITKPGTAFLLGYRKSAEEPCLVLTCKGVTRRVDKRISRSSVSGGGQQGARIGLDHINFTQRKPCHAHAYLSFVELTLGIGECLPQENQFSRCLNHAVASRRPRSLDTLSRAPDDVIHLELNALKGVGPWTAAIYNVSGWLCWFFMAKRAAARWFGPAGPT